MKVRHTWSVELRITEFDDRKKWVAVTRSETGRPARTAWQTRAEDTILDDDLDVALMTLDELAQVAVNRFRRSQQALF